MFFLSGGIGIYIASMHSPNVGVPLAVASGISGLIHTTAFMTPTPLPQMTGWMQSYYTHWSSFLIGLVAYSLVAPVENETRIYSSTFSFALMTGSSMAFIFGQYAIYLDENTSKLTSQTLAPNVFASLPIAILPFLYTVIALVLPALQAGTSFDYFEVMFILMAFNLPFYNACRAFLAERLAKKSFYALFDDMIVMDIALLYLGAALLRVNVYNGYAYENTFIFLAIGTVGSKVALVAAGQ